MHIVIDNQTQRDAMPAGIKSVVVDSDPQRLIIVKELLNNMGINAFECCSSFREVNVDSLAPEGRNEILIAYIEKLNEGILSDLQKLLSQRSVPVLFLIEEIDRKEMTIAMEAGVTAFISLGVQRNRINHAINAAFANFDTTKLLKNKIDQLEDRLENRIVIDKAKGLIMKNRGMDEEQAYSFLRNYAMKNGKRMIEVAEMTIQTAELLSKSD